MATCCAIDIGAESGRLMCGTLSNKKLSIKEIKRFPNGLVQIHEGYHWNLIGLYRAIVDGLKECAESGCCLSSIGVDTWGNDFVLLAKDKSLLGVPVAYRHPRVDDAMDSFLSINEKGDIYSRTGIQFMKYNSLYQLHSMVAEKSPLLDIAEHFLFVPDYLNYLLTGKITTEYTNATTSQILNSADKKWDPWVIKQLGVKENLFGTIVEPGAVVGELVPELCSITGSKKLPVIAPATHDTGSAVAAVPAEGDDWIYISSGTWSLMGIETDQPITTPLAMEHNFTNEGGVENTIRFLKNIVGLWLVQKVRGEIGTQWDYGTLTAMADEHAPFEALIDPDHPSFLNPTSMTDAIVDFCKNTGQRPPTTPGGFVRCCLESLALQYRFVLDELKEITGKTFSTIHVIGGGSKNELLCKMTANATGLKVKSGPTEATAIGNLLIQLKTLGHIESLNEARQIVANSFEMKFFAPTDTEIWEKHYQKFQSYKGASA